MGSLEKRKQEPWLIATMQRRWTSFNAVRMPSLSGTVVGLTNGGRHLPIRGLVFAIADVYVHGRH